MTRKLSLFFSLAALFLVQCQASDAQVSHDALPNAAKISDEGGNARWSALQMKRGNFDFISDPDDGSKKVISLTAGPKQFGKVGKAALIYRFPPAYEGQSIKMSGRFYFPDKTPLNSLILMDLECAACGPDTNPGIRLYLRDGLIRIDRSKIGIDTPFLPHTDLRLSTSQWHHIEWHVILGQSSNGKSTVWLNGEEVLYQNGTTLLSQEIIKALTDRPVLSAVDRFQIGLTANSNSEPVIIHLDDVSYDVR